MPFPQSLVTFIWGRTDRIGKRVERRAKRESRTRDKYESSDEAARVLLPPSTHEKLLRSACALRMHFIKIPLIPTR